MSLFNPQVVPHINIGNKGNKVKAKDINNNILEFDIINGKVNCSESNIIEILYIPYNTISLDCSNNKLKYLPELKNITYLNCSYNQLVLLPNNLSKITYLDCKGNNLTFIPKNSNNIDRLNCELNKLTSLPDLPNCYNMFIYSGGNNLIYPLINKTKEFYKNNINVFDSNQIIEF